MSPPNGITVVKLGGSYAASPQLTRWLEAIANLAGRVVLVPGGGPFADAVRDAQRTMRFGDGAAHVMAMLAMEQYAMALADLRPALKPARSMAAIRRACAAAEVPVWCPVPMALRDSSIPQSWDITSDTLALWLAARLRAGRVILVKAVPAPLRSAAELSSAGVLDKAFPAMLGRTVVEVWVAGPESHGAVPAVLSGEPAPGIVRIRA